MYTSQKSPSLKSLVFKLLPAFFGYYKRCLGIFLLRLVYLTLKYKKSKTKNRQTLSHLEEILFKTKSSLDTTTILKNYLVYNKVNSDIKGQHYLSSYTPTVVFKDVYKNGIRDSYKNNLLDIIIKHLELNNKMLLNVETSQFFVRYYFSKSEYEESNVWIYLTELKKKLINNRKDILKYLGL